VCEFRGQTDRRLGLDPAGRDPYHPNAFRTDFFGQALAVRGKSAFAAAYASVASGSGNWLWIDVM
jgi:hypothetical protein